MNYTGFVIPVGDGSVGKSSLARVLANLAPEVQCYEPVLATRKTKNLEFEFVPAHVTYKGQSHGVLIQLLIPPGQKDAGGEQANRSFEEVVEIYRFYIRRVDVVLFTYDLTQRESFNALDHWIGAVTGLCRAHTHFVLLGTHLDQAERREIDAGQIEAGTAYVQTRVEGLIPGWKGRCYRMEISNFTGEHVKELKQNLAWSIIHSRSITP